MQLSRPTWTRRRVLAPTEPIESPDQIGLPDVLRGGPEPLVVETGCVIDGHLHTHRPVLIEGDVCGSVECSSVVVIAAAGSVQGDIRARSVFIEGAVVGDVFATRELELGGSARLHGDITTSSFALARGAYFNGHTTMLRPQDVDFRNDRV